jgi:hypothetical protein
MPSIAKERMAGFVGDDRDWDNYRADLDAQALAAQQAWEWLQSVDELAERWGEMWDEGDCEEEAEVELPW